MKNILILILVLMALTACAPDPRRSAQAYQIRIQADIDAANAQQMREYQQQVNAIQAQALRVDEANQEATAQNWHNALNMTLRYGAYVMTAAVCFILFMAARSIATSIATATEGLSKAVVSAADVRAHLIRLDPVTRQYPVYLQYLGQGKFSAVNLNVNAVLMLDTRNEPDRQMIAAMGATQYAGALAHEARQAQDPTGVTMLQTPIIDAKSELLSIGRDLVRNE